MSMHFLELVNYLRTYPRALIPSLYLLRLSSSATLMYVCMYAYVPISKNSPRNIEREVYRES